MDENALGQQRITEVFKILSGDVTELHYLRNTYTFLFTSDHFAELFTRTAPAFFTDIYMMLFEGMALSASRLLDWARSSRSSGSRDNCSLAQLLSLIEKTGENQSLWLRLTSELEEVRANNPLKFFRDRRYGHRDLEFALGKLSEQSGVDLGDLDRLLDGIDGIMNAVAEACGCNADTFFGLIPAVGAQQIVARLQVNESTPVPAPGRAAEG